MCQYCRTDKRHRSEKCPVLKLIWDKDVDMVDGLDSRSGADKKELDATTCIRPDCLNPRMKGSTRCLKHTHDVFKKRKRRGAIITVKIRPVAIQTKSAQAYR